MPLARRLATALLLCAGTWAVMPGTALAGKASVSGSTLTYAAAPGEANALTVERLASFYRVTDAGAIVTVGAGCSNASARVATCPLGTINLLNLTLLDRDDSALIGGTTPARIYGGVGTDDLAGGGGADLLDSGPGEAERLRGGAGADKLTALASDGLGDRLSGGSGDDVLTGASKATPIGIGFLGGYFLAVNRFEGGPGRDLVTGSAVADALDGGTGPDDLAGGPGGVDAAVYASRTEAVTVTLGTSAVTNGGGSDGGVVSGKARRDKLTGIAAVIGGAGADRLTGSAQGNTMFGGGGDDTISGGDGADVLCGDAQVVSSPSGGLTVTCNAEGATGTDALDGGAGDDVLDGGPGPDELGGGSGRDAAVYSQRTRGVRAAIKDTCGGTACAIANDGEFDANPGVAGDQPEGDRIALDVEDAAGGDGNDILSGSSAANGLFGGRGRDTLYSLDGDDVLCGDGYFFAGSTSGNCSSGFFVNRRVAVAAFDEAAGDWLDAGPGADVLDGGDGPDEMAGGTGIDWVDYSQKGSSVVATIADTCAGSSQPCAKANDGRRDVDSVTPDDQPEGDKIALDVENLAGTGYGDSLAGSAAANVLSGSGADDSISGLGGDDWLEPGSGDGDVVTGGTGRDFASFRRSRFESFGCAYCFGVGVTVTLDGIANDTTTGYGESDNILADVEGVLGTDFEDSITGRTGVFADTLLGYGGSDVLDGNAGDDGLTGGAGMDTVRGDDGADVLSIADGEVDTADCGGGLADRVVRDAGDGAVGCETGQVVTAPSAARLDGR